MTYTIGITAFLGVPTSLPSFPEARKTLKSGPFKNEGFLRDADVDTVVDRVDSVWSTIGKGGALRRPRSASAATVSRLPRSQDAPPARFRGAGAAPYRRELREPDWRRRRACGASVRNRVRRDRV